MQMPGSMQMPGTMQMPGSMMGPPPGSLPPGAPGSMPYGAVPYGAAPPGSMPPMGSGPCGHPPMSYPPGSMAGPMMTMPPGSCAAPGGPPPVPYAVVQQQLGQRVQQTMQKRAELISDLDWLTDGEYTEHVKNTFSISRQTNLDGVDWRVPRLLYCKDPKFNDALGPALAFDVQQRKVRDGGSLEKSLAAEATANWAKALEPCGLKPPPLEVYAQDPVAFVEACPNYQADDDVWTRRLELRTLDEAMRGDVSKPLPRPAVHTEDYENFREGKYVKDDCPIA